MATVSVTPAALVGLLQEVLKREPETRFVGIQAADWSGGQSLRIGEVDVPVRFCSSALAVRDALVELGKQVGPVALLTPCPPEDLGQDVIARLSRRKLLPIDAWKIVEGLFAANRRDPSLRGKWFAEALLEGVSPSGYPSVAGGFLDVDAAYDALLRQLGFADGRPDARTLLEWTLDAGNCTRFTARPDEQRKALAARLRATAGSVGAAILGAVSAGHGDDALALGLVCEVVFAQDAHGAPELLTAAGRLELYTGAPLDGETARGWAREAVLVVEALLRAPGKGLAAARQRTDRAEQLLRELHIVGHMGRSTVLPTALERRFDAYAEALSAAVAAKSPEPAEALRSAVGKLREHVLSGAAAVRLEAVTMSMRLWRWLQRPVVEPRSLAEAARGYADQSAFVDWARTMLCRGETSPALADAYQGLLAQVEAAREAENERFAALLADATAAGGKPAGLVPVEDVLSTVVGPLAAWPQGVLLLVMDGMSCAVFRELAQELPSRGWTELVPDEPGVRQLALAMVPSVTRLSRASLLCGALVEGTDSREKDGFSTAPALLTQGRGTHPPRLFHKSELAEIVGGRLGRELTDALGRKEQRVVGVVVNAVDDHLLKGDQLPVRWSVEMVRPLEGILDAARRAGRVIVLTSDHGHVLERGGALRRTGAAAGEGGERWRPAAGETEPDEVVLAGPRVLEGGGRIIATWSEGVRYSPKRHGYHGGAAPQEMVIPLAIFSPTSATPAGWTQAPPDSPDWWDEPHEGLRMAALRMVALSPVASSLPRGPAAQPGPEVRSEAPAAAGLDWLDALLASPVLAQQKPLLGRVRLPDADVRRLLSALDGQGGKLTRIALARTLGLAELRLNGLLAAASKLLNVEGFEVLRLDHESDTVELNRPLLATQFGIA